MNEHRSNVRWRQRVTRLDDGTELVRLLPEPVVPARARLGMAVIDCTSGETGLIVQISARRCVYQTPGGRCVRAAWAGLCLTAVEADDRDG